MRPGQCGDERRGVHHPWLRPRPVADPPQVLGAGRGAAAIGEHQTEHRPPALRVDPGDLRALAIDRGQRIADAQVADRDPAGGRAHRRIVGLGLAHRRAPGHDHQVAGLQAGSHAVQIGKTGGHTRHIAAGATAVQLVDPLDDLAQQVLQVLETGRSARAVLRDLEDLGLGLVEHLPGVLALRIERLGGDLIGGRDQLAQDGAVAHDLAIAADIGGRRGLLGQRIQVGQPAHLVGLADRFQRLIDCDHVGGMAALDQARNLLPDQPVVVAVEVFIAQQVGHAVEGLVVQQQSAEHRLFGLDRMRRHPQCGHFPVGRCAGRLESLAFAAHGWGDWGEDRRQGAPILSTGRSQTKCMNRQRARQ